MLYLSHWLHQGVSCIGTVQYLYLLLEEKSFIKFIE